MTDASPPKCPDPPQFQPGDEISEGRFWRNLQKKDLVKRYSGDTIPPEFGLRVRSKGWDWLPDGLSVNYCECACAPCSMRLHPSPELFESAVAVDLSHLSKAIAMEIVAQYTPEQDPANPCHFNFIPTDGPLLDFGTRINLLMDRLLEGEFPKVKRPGSETDQRLARIAQQKYGDIFSRITKKSPICARISEGDPIPPSGMDQP